jgi:hypothetical protein
LEHNRSKHALFVGVSVVSMESQWKFNLIKIFRQTGNYKRNWNVCFSWNYNINMCNLGRKGSRWPLDHVVQRQNFEKFQETCKKSERNKYQIFQSQSGKRPLLHLTETIFRVGPIYVYFLQILNNASIPHISTKLLD